MSDDDALNRPLNEPGPSLSPSEHHSITSVQHLAYWDYDPDGPLKCPACGWHGSGKGLEELFRELLDVKCPQCACILLIVMHPTDDETRAAAAAGNVAAIDALPSLDARGRLSQLRDELELTASSTLPALAGESLVITWDYYDDGTTSWTVLRHEDIELWREPAYYEGADRFKVVASILQSTFGDRLAELRPTAASDLYLYGDQFSAPGKVANVNDALRERRPV